MRIDGLFSGQLANIINNSDILSRINIGDVVRAQILSITANDVLLKLLDGTNVKAATTSPVDAKQGDFVDFTVKSKTDSQLILETVKNNDPKPVDAEGELKKQLVSLGIKPDDKNLEIAKQIKYNDLSLTKDIFEKVSDIISDFKSIDPAKAAFLQANNLQPDGNNLSTLNRLIEGKAQIGSNLNEIMESLNNIDDKTLLENLSQKLSEVDSKNFIQSSLSEVDTKETPEVSGKLISGYISNEIDNIENSNLKTLIQSLKSDNKLDNFLKSDLLQSNNKPEKISEFIKNNLNDFDKLSLNDKQDVENFIKDLAVKISSNKELSDRFNQARSSEDNDFNPDKAKEIIHKAFDNIYTKITSGKLDKDIDIKSIYKEIYSKLETVKESVGASNLPGSNDLVNKIDNMQNNIKFLNELNNYSTYIQIPLTIQGQNTTGDLYILKRDPKRKKLDPENVTMLISLNTTNIGQVDSLISLNKKNVSVNMRVEDQNVFELIKEGYKDLYNGLSQKGFKLVDLKYKLMEDKANILNAKDLVKKEIQYNKLSVDYRV